jgi:hypothetical protein
MLIAGGHDWELHEIHGFYFLRLYLRGKAPKKYFDNLIQIPLADERVYKNIIRHRDNIKSVGEKNEC